MQALQRIKMCWFMACGLIHSVLEGYFALFHKTLAGEQTFLAQLCKCKVYSLYLHSYIINLHSWKSTTTCYKKVLLRERRRHTARRVASTRYAVPDIKVQNVSSAADKFRLQK